MSRRSGTAAAILLLWISGLALLARRELFRGPAERLARAGLLVAPGAEYFSVSFGDRQIGFASSTVDTTAGGIEITDFLLADLQADSAMHRASARIRVRLSRALKLREFVFELGPAVGPLKATGRVTGDSSLTIVIAAGAEAPDTQRVRLNRPLLLPSVVPLVLALAESPDVGKRYTFSVFDPVAMRPSDMTVAVTAESLFVVADSASFDTRLGRYIPARHDTVRAWRVEQDGGGPLSGWIDEKGRMVQATQLGTFELRRTAFEIAYENWVAGARLRPRSLNRARDIQEVSAIAASAPIPNRRSVTRLRVRFRHVDLSGFDLHGPRQRLLGDTLEVTREGADALQARYTLPADRGQFRAELAAEPLVQVEDPQIAALAARIVGGERDPRVAAERITRWVNASLAKKISLSIPNALEVLRTRRGDCNEHTQLFIALARAAGIPARGAAGLTYVSGKFYYHAWPEVYLGDWVPVDPTFGQFPADAAHLRFVVGGFARQAELLKLIGTLQVDVLSSE